MIEKQQHVEPSQGRLLSCFCLELTIVHGVRTWPHSLNCVHACVRLLFEGGYYLGCGIYSNKYGMCSKKLMSPIWLQQAQNLAWKFSITVKSPYCALCILMHILINNLCVYAELLMFCRKCQIWKQTLPPIARNGLKSAVMTLHSMHVYGIVMFPLTIYPLAIWKRDCNEFSDNFFLHSVWSPWNYTLSRKKSKLK